MGCEVTGLGASASWSREKAGELGVGMVNAGAGHRRRRRSRWDVTRVGVS